MTSPLFDPPPGNPAGGNTDALLSPADLRRLAREGARKQLQPIVAEILAAMRPEVRAAVRSTVSEILSMRADRLVAAFRARQTIEAAIAEQARDAAARIKVRLEVAGE